MTQRRAFLAAILGGTASLALPKIAAAQQSVYRITNVDNWASLRRNPSTQEPRLTKVPYGARVVHTGGVHQSLYHEWLEVTYNGLTGWIPTDYLAYDGKYHNPGHNGGYDGGSYQIVNVNNWASLRSAPSRSASRLAKVPRGHVVDWAGSSTWVGGEQWHQVIYAGYTGWIPAQYLSEY